jgi:hypothetical protein
MRVAIARVYAVSEIVFVNLPRRFDETLFSIEGDDIYRAEIAQHKLGGKSGVCRCSAAQPHFPTA